MKLVDIGARNSKEVEKLRKQMVALCKKQGNHIGHVDYHVDGTHHTITIENSNGGLRVKRLGVDTPGYGFSSDMEDLVKASATAIFVDRDEHPGFFDWKADTYIKDASSVTFRF